MGASSSYQFNDTFLSAAASLRKFSKFDLDMLDDSIQPYDYLTYVECNEYRQPFIEDRDDIWNPRLTWKTGIDNSSDCYDTMYRYAKILPIDKEIM